MLLVLLALLPLAVASDTQGAEVEPGDRAPSAAPTLRQLTLSDGQTLIGLLVQDPDGTVHLTLRDGQTLVVPPALVATVGEAPPGTSWSTLPLPALGPGEPARSSPSGWAEDPNKVAYFYAPSAFTLGHGRGYLTDKEVLFTAAAYGIVDGWDVQVGTAVPLLFTEARLAVVGTKFGGRVHRYLHVAAGAQAFLIQSEVLALPFGTVTVGDEDHHLSVISGYPLLTGGTGGAPFVPVVVGGSWRLGPKAAVWTEDWSFITIDRERFFTDYFLFPAGGARLFGPRFAVDLGLGVVAVSDSPVVPIPLVGFTWNWSVPGRGGAASASAWSSGAFGGGLSAAPAAGQRSWESLGAAPSPLPFGLR